MLRVCVCCGMPGLVGGVLSPTHEMRNCQSSNSKTKSSLLRINREMGVMELKSFPVVISSWATGGNLLSLGRGKENREEGGERVACRPGQWVPVWGSLQPVPGPL